MLVIAISLVGLILRDFFSAAFLYSYHAFPLRTVYAAPLLVVVGSGPTVIGGYPYVEESSGMSSGSTFTSGYTVPRI